VGCPDENTLAALVEGNLPTDARADYARHLDECAACREEVGSLVRLMAVYPRDGGPTVDPALARTVASESGARPPSPGRQGFVAGDVVGRYELERVLGEGGLGVVWAARHATTRKPVALKFMKFGDPELGKRFLREARVGAALNHPAAVPVHDIFESEPGGPLVMVMDLLVGEPLDQLLLVRGSLGLDETLRIMHPVIAAVGAAHALGIVHRDIKPGNIFVVRAEHDKGGPPARLLDFGLARLTATEGAVAATSVLTREKTLMGTPHYMAPEQLYGEADIDARADVWAVGAVLFECLSGRHPLEGATIGQILRSLATTEVPPLASIAAGTPPALGRAVDACLARDRNTRPFSVNPLLEAIEAQLLVQTSQ
jgi:serine/threonine-protein kinase